MAVPYIASRDQAYHRFHHRESPHRGWDFAALPDQNKTVTTDCHRLRLGTGGSNIICCQNLQKMTVCFVTKASPLLESPTRQTGVAHRPGWGTSTTVCFGRLSKPKA